VFLIGAPRSRRSIFSPAYWRDCGIAATVPRDALLLQGPGHDGLAALTFEGGPHPWQTPAILKVLAAFRTPATFFVTGENARQYPDILDAIVETGHTVGHCGYSEQSSASKRNDVFLEEVMMAEHWITKVTEEPPRLYRPGMGKWRRSHLRLMQQRGQTIVLWNHDPRDLDASSAGELCVRFADSQVRAGDIIRLHDAGPFTAEALKKLIPGLKRSGVQFGTPLQWLGSQKINGRTFTQPPQAIING